MLTRTSTDGREYEVLDKPRYWRILKNGKVVKHFSVITYELENKLDFEWDMFEEGYNEIMEIDGKTVEIHEFNYSGYVIQMYREIKLL